jgi:hypothetical protein
MCGLSQQRWRRWDFRTVSSLFFNLPECFVVCWCWFSGLFPNTFSLKPVVRANEFIQSPPFTKHLTISMVFRLWQRSGVICPRLAWPETRWRSVIDKVNWAAQNVLPETLTNFKIYHRNVAKWTWEKKNWQLTQPVAESLHCRTSRWLRDIQAFARLGGPDLSNLYGVYNIKFLQTPKLADLIPNMPPPLWTRRWTRASKFQGFKLWLKAIPKTTITKSSGPYDQQHLVDHGICPHRYRFWVDVQH